MAFRSVFRSIGMKLVAIVAALVLFLMGTAAGVSYEAGTFLRDLDRQEQTNTRVDALERLLISVQSAEAGLHAFIVSGDSADLAPFEEAGSDSHHIVEALRAAYRPFPGQEERIALIEAGVTARLRNLQRIAAERRQHGMAAAQRMLTGDLDKMIVQDLRGNVALLLADERASLGLQREITHSRLRAVIVLWLMLIAATVAAVAVSMVQVVKQVQRNGTLMHRLQHDAHHDFLTGLPNRAFFAETLTHIIAWAEREKMRAAVLYMDLNGFKGVNDQLGHEVGDMVLIEVANRLRASVRSADFLARLGGDEFAVLVPGYSHDRELTELVGRIEEAVRQVSFPALRGHCVTISVGVASFPDQCGSAQAMVEAADRNMFSAKRGENIGGTAAS
jgi:diguanylate cyclase (GGDEF)-like protein